VKKLYIVERKEGLEPVLNLPFPGPQLPCLLVTHSKFQSPSGTLSNSPDTEVRPPRLRRGVQVFCRKAMGQDQFLGEVNVPVAYLGDNLPRYLWLTLQKRTEKDRVTGDLRLRLHWWSDVVMADEEQGHALEVGRPLHRISCYQIWRAPLVLTGPCAKCTRCVVVKILEEHQRWPMMHLHLLRRRLTEALTQWESESDPERVGRSDRACSFKCSRENHV
jgi:hypothetical protein